MIRRTVSLAIVASTAVLLTACGSGISEATAKADRALSDASTSATDMTSTVAPDPASQIAAANRAADEQAIRESGHADFLAQAGKDNLLRYAKSSEETLKLADDICNSDLAKATDTLTRSGFSSGDAATFVGLASTTVCKS